MLESLPARPYGRQLAELAATNAAFGAFRQAVYVALRQRDGHRITQVNGVPLTDDMREEALLLSRTHAADYTDAIAFCMYRGLLYPDVPAAVPQPRERLDHGMAVQPVRLSTENPLRLVLATAMAVRGNVYTSPGIKAVASYFQDIQDFLDCLVRQTLDSRSDESLQLADVEFSLNFAERPDSPRGTYTLNLTTRVHDGTSRMTFTFQYLGNDNLWRFYEVATPNRTFEYPVRFASLPPATVTARPPEPEVAATPQRARRCIRLGD